MPGKVCYCCNNVTACKIIAIVSAAWHIYLTYDLITLLLLKRMVTDLSEEWQINVVYLLYGQS